jgi:NADH-quinone oxidoreductase subunit L
VLGVLACVTMLGAALAALAEDDLKRVLAWSTVSQLGYMGAGLAVGGWAASVWHLLTHAAFKALLFLAAGSVLRAVGTTSMAEMGGLWRRMPVTFATALVGAAALAGIPPFAGAFSKDAILDAARARGGSLGTAVYVVGLVTVVVTAGYVTRFVVRTFLGAPRGAVVPHESPLVMTAPLVLLAAAAVGLGLPVLGLSALPSSYAVAHWLPVPPGTEPIVVGATGAALTAGLAVAAVAVVLAWQRRHPGRDVVAALGPVAVPLAAAFWVDELYAAAVVRPVRRAAAAVLRLDVSGIDGVVRLTGRGARTAGAGMRLVQNGNVQLYLTALVLAVVVTAGAVAVAVG